MYALLIRILTFVFVIGILRWILDALFNKNRQRMNPTSAASGRKINSDTVRDPVCGMYMDPRLAVRLEYKQGSYYFCSDECKQKFVAKPS
jgi:uncharacterized protein